jgi:hypothetical protein
MRQFRRGRQVAESDIGLKDFVFGKKNEKNRKKTNSISGDVEL